VPARPRQRLEGGLQRIERPRLARFQVGHVPRSLVVQHQVHHRRVAVGPVRHELLDPDHAGPRVRQPPPEPDQVRPDHRRRVLLGGTPTLDRFGPRVDRTAAVPILFGDVLDRSHLAGGAQDTRDPGDPAAPQRVPMMLAVECELHGYLRAFLRDGWTA